MIQTRESSITDVFNFVKQVGRRGGPDVSEYDDFCSVIRKIGDLRRSGKWQPRHSDGLRRMLGRAFSVDTIQGHVFHRPHGYVGDYEIIDRIYQHWVSPDPRLKAWDHLFHELSAARAVRNRKSLFLQLMENLYRSTSGPLAVLNVASGPCRDVLELLSRGKAPLCVHLCRSRPGCHRLRNQAIVRVRETSERFTTSGSATYKFDEVTTGWYRISAGTPGHSSSTDSAVYTMKGGVDPIVTTIDQRPGTNGWRELGVIEVTGNSLEVLVKRGGTTGYLRTDAVRVERLTVPFEIREVELNAYLATASKEQASALTSQGTETLADGTFVAHATAFYSSGTNRSRPLVVEVSATASHQLPADEAKYSVERFSPASLAAKLQVFGSFANHQFSVLDMPKHAIAAAQPSRDTVNSLRELKRVDRLFSDHGAAGNDHQSGKKRVGSRFHKRLPTLVFPEPRTFHAGTAYCILLVPGRERWAKGTAARRRGIPLIVNWRGSKKAAENQLERSKPPTSLLALLGDAGPFGLRSLLRPVRRAVCGRVLRPSGRCAAKTPDGCSLEEEQPR